MKKRTKKAKNMKKMGFYKRFFKKYRKKHISLVSNHRHKGNKIPSKIRPSQYNKTAPDRYFEQ